MSHDALPPFSVAGDPNSGHGSAEAAAMKASPDLLALLVFCAAAAPMAPAQSPGGGPPHGPPPRGLGPDSRSGAPLSVPLPASLQPAPQVLSSLTPEQKVAGFCAN